MMSPTARGATKLATVSVIVAGICFGTTGTSQTLYGKGVNPLALGSARLFVGAIVLWLISMKVHTAIRFPRKQLWVCALGVASYQLAFFTAVHLTGVALATITALGSAPIFTGVLAWRLGHEKPSRVWITATGITTIGIIALNAHADKSQFDFGGVLLALGAGAGFATFNVVGRKVLISDYPLSHFISRSFALAALLIFPLIFLGNMSWLTSTKGIGLVLWLGIIATALAYTLYGFGLSHLKASNASTLVLAEPVTATILSVTVLHNRLSAVSWGGVVIVLIGLMYLGLKG